MHYDGGAVEAFELTNYPVRMIAMNALPPGEGPQLDERWRDRIDSTPPWVLRWLAEQHDGLYWRNGSLRPEYERIECPVFIVSGWHDGYRTAGLRMAEKLRSPWHLLAGPWTTCCTGSRRSRSALSVHASADRVLPRAPGAGLRRAPFRPRSVFFIEEHDSPAGEHAEVSGEWLGGDASPGSRSSTTLTLGGPQTAPASAAVGLRTGNWCPPPPGSGMFGDQRPDEALSACVETEPLDEAVTVLGAPRVRFRIDQPGPRAIVSVKLNDVSPEGECQPVTRGAMNVRCDGETAVELDLMATGWRFRPGHRIRIAVVGNDWPCLWPLPNLAPLQLASPVELILPGLPADAAPFAVAGELVPLSVDESGDRREAGTLGCRAGR